jgi:hypothetical protein
MPTMRPPSQSVVRARSYTTYRVGYCLNFVWNAIAAPQHLGISDANAGWAATRNRHSSLTPPAGVPVYWAGGNHGHVALSVGGGRVRSTDYPHRGTVGEVGIAELTRVWHLTYRGWGSDYCGNPIPGLPSSSDSTRNGS